MNELSVIQTGRAPLICRICGDRARGLNFDVTTCMSCKAFFRRNALKPARSLCCTHNNECHITKETRIKCAACRLRKCLIYGMKAELIRSFSEHQMNNEVIPWNSQWTMQLPLPQPIGLLRNDRSSMTTEHWNLLSNIIHAYDQQNISSQLKHALKQQSSLPVKLRTKTSSAMNYMFRSIQSAQELLRECTDFHTLPLSSRRALIKNNLFLTGCINALLIGYEIDLWDNADFAMSCDALFGPGHFQNSAPIPKRMDPNGILFKIFLFVISFSSDCSIVIFDRSFDATSSFDCSMTLQIQDFYVTLLWKYLAYQYGFTEAVLRFASLVKTVLDVLLCLEDLAETEVYQQSMATAILHAERLLIIDD